MVFKKVLFIGSFLFSISFLQAVTIKIKNSYNPRVVVELVIPDKANGLDVKNALYQRLFNVEPTESNLAAFTIICDGKRLEDADLVPEQILRQEKPLFYRHEGMKEDGLQYYPQSIVPDSQVGFFAYLKSLGAKIGI